MVAKSQPKQLSMHAHSHISIGSLNNMGKEMQAFEGERMGF